jgi:8-oxo-dGTP pyrophosphatase MutT (NUDIX family)
VKASRPLDTMINGYTPVGANERVDVGRVAELLATGNDPWHRSSPLHCTASALVVDVNTKRVLLRWHERQQAWIQVGGHADPDEHDPLRIARREAGEETGLIDLVALADGRPIHIVVVPVPANAIEPAHEHADIRYVLATGSADRIQPETPHAPLQWLTFDEAGALTTEANVRESLTRAEQVIVDLIERQS